MWVALWNAVRRSSLSLKQKYRTKRIKLMLYPRVHFYSYIHTENELDLFIWIHYALRFLYLISLTVFFFLVCFGFIFLCRDWLLSEVLQVSNIDLLWLWIPMCCFKIFYLLLYRTLWGYMRQSWSFPSISWSFVLDIERYYKENVVAYWFE